MNRLVKCISLSVVILSFAMSSWALPAQATCTQDYIQAVNDCSNLDGWIARGACGLDAALSYAGCVRRTIFD